jgi:hypothetical protein
VGFEVARDLLQLGESPVYPSWLVSRLWFMPEMRSTGSLVIHLKHNPDCQGQFTITLGNYAKRNAR